VETEKQKIKLKIKSLVKKLKRNLGQLMWSLEFLDLFSKPSFNVTYCIKAKAFGALLW